ncbi:hypothetical protein DBR06_SOUSAS12110017 [Sousa chinensis]|nr:hypothetical protein DBR06_SOUSAS12110017 [Sousa chinensis]
MISISTPSKKSIKAKAAATDKHEYKGHGYSPGCDILCYNCFPMFKGGRCLCTHPGVKAVKVADIQKVSIIYPSNNCDKIEVIITLKTHKGQRCLNTNSKQAKVIIKKAKRMNFLKYQKV